MTYHLIKLFLHLSILTVLGTLSQNGITISGQHIGTLGTAHGIRSLSMSNAVPDMNHSISILLPFYLRNKIPLFDSDNITLLSSSLSITQSYALISNRNYSTLNTDCEHRSIN